MEQKPIILKRCGLCKKLKTINKFDFSYTRTYCQKCKSLRRIRSINASPKSYIGNLVTQLKYSRKKQGHKWNLTASQIWDIYEKQDGKCALSGVQMTHFRTHGEEGEANISIDRIDPEGLYVLANIQLVCKRVNYMKHNKDQKTFLNWVGLIYNNSNND